MSQELQAGPHKQPRSVQVVMFAEGAAGREYLLLRRVQSHGGFWQSVTGSLEHVETHRQAAVREVTEETGIICAEDELTPLGLTNRFEIAPQWRSKYAAGVTHNEEVCFLLRVARQEVRLDSLEHDDYSWVEFKAAVLMVYWESTKRALAAAEKLLAGAAADRV